MYITYAGAGRDCLLRENLKISGLAYLLDCLLLLSIFKININEIGKFNIPHINI